MSAPDKATDQSAPDKATDQRGPGPQWLKRWTARRHEARMQHVRERSLATLKQSLREAGSQLNPDWVREDPDFFTFKETKDREFQQIVPPRRSKPRAAPWKPEKPEPDEAGPLPIPPRPWGDFTPRLRFWLAVAFLSLLAVLILVLGFDDVDGLILIAFVILAITAVRAAHARWEGRLSKLFAPRTTTATPAADGKRPIGDDGNSGAR